MQRDDIDRSRDVGRCHLLVQVFVERRRRVKGSREHRGRGETVGSLGVPLVHWSIYVYVQTVEESGSKIHDDNGCATDGRAAADDPRPAGK